MEKTKFDKASVLLHKIEQCDRVIESECLEDDGSQWIRIGIHGKLAKLPKELWDVFKEFTRVKRDEYLKEFKKL